MWHECARRAVHIGYWWESQKEGDNFEAQDVGGWTILERYDGLVWIGLMWFRIGTSGSLM